MIGITGVTGKLGSYVSDLVDKKRNCFYPSGNEVQSGQQSTRQRKFVRWCMPILQRWLRSLKGIDVLLMVSARENPERVEEHKSFFRCRKACWGAAYRLYLLFWGR